MLGLLSGCSTDDIEAWKAKGYAWFTNESTDFTFKQHPEVGEGESYLVPIPITVAAQVSDKDRTVEVEVSREPADSRTRYEIQKPVTFRAGHIVDTLFVKVTNSAHLNEVHDTISFRILPSADFDAGLKDKITTNLCLFNGFAQPEWWDSKCESYFGYFTQLKMEVFLAVAGNTEDPSGGNGWSNNINVTYLTVMLNDYIKEHDIRYPDNDPNAPGQQPEFDWRSY